MAKSQKFRLMIFILLMIATTTALASGLSDLSLSAGRPVPILEILRRLGGTGLPLPGLPQLPFNVIPLLVGCAWSMIIIMMVLFILMPNKRKELLKRILTYTVWLLVIYALVFSFHPGQLAEFEPPVQNGASSGEAFDEDNPLFSPPEFVIAPPAWFVIIISGLVLTGLFLIMWAVWRRLPKPLEPFDNEAALERLGQEAQEAIDRLQAGHDLKDTIQRCYFEMGQILSQQYGYVRQHGMTPREFEQHLSQSGLHSQHIQRLTRLFEMVRYSPHQADAQTQAEAEACLTAIVKTYWQQHRATA